MEGTLENLPKFSGNVITNEVRFLVGSTIHLLHLQQLGNLLRMRQMPLKLEDFPEEILRDVRGCCIFLNACLIFISVFFLRQSKMYSTFPVYRISRLNSNRILLSWHKQEDIWHAKSAVMPEDLRYKSQSSRAWQPCQTQNKYTFGFKQKEVQC
jgi:hypothetical protein